MLHNTESITTHTHIHQDCTIVTLTHTHTHTTYRLLQLGYLNLVAIYRGGDLPDLSRHPANSGNISGSLFLQSINLSGVEGDVIRVASESQLTKGGFYYTKHRLLYSITLRKIRFPLITSTLLHRSLTTMVQVYNRMCMWLQQTHLAHKHNHLVKYKLS